MAEAAGKKDLFSNRKAELYWSIRERFQRGLIGGLEDDTTIAQISSIKWRNNPQNGLIEVESKESLRKRGVASPDRAEGLMLCFADVEKPFERKALPPSLSFHSY